MALRKFTIKTELQSVDKSTKNVNKVNKAYERLTKTVTKESKIAGNSFTRFSKQAGLGAKRAMVSMNNMNASINRTFRNISKRLGSFGLLFGFSAITLGLRNIIGKTADYEQANAGLAAVMGTTIEENEKLIKDSKRLGAVTAKSATQVVGLQEAFARLGFAESAILNMTESTISGSVAMRGELDQTAELVGAMIKSFDQFESVNAPQIIDQLTSSTQKSALNFEKLQTALPIVAGAANAAKIPFSKLLALLGKLSDAGIDASSSSTALRNIILESSKQGKNYEEILGDIVKNQDKLTSSMDAFGKRAAVPATVLAGKLNETLELSNDILNDNDAAAIAATKQLNTLKGTVTILKSAWEGWILSLDDGTGKFNSFLKTSIKVVTEVLSIATGTAKMSNELNEAELRIRKIANTAMVFLKIIKLIIIAFIAFKTVLLASKIAIGAYNIAIGIMGALSGSASIAIGSNTIALTAYKVVSGLATAAQWLLNTAFYGFPLVWILAAIAAVVAGIVHLVKNWDEMSAKLTKDWNRIKTTFEKNGLGGVFKMWGKDLVIYLLEPLQNLLAIMAKVTGGKGWEDLLEKTIQTRNKLLREAGRSEEALITKRQLKAGSISNGMSNEQMQLKRMIEGKSFATTITKGEDKLVQSLNNNTKELEKNTSAAKNGWTGKFRTTILKDANINERTSRIVQRELSTTAITNENNIVKDQKEIVTSNNAPKSVITQGNALARSSKTMNGQININVVDKTGSEFALEVESTGVDVITTGN